MADFFQNGLITTLHDLRADNGVQLEQILVDATRNFRLGLIPPITASDMRAAPFSHNVQELSSGTDMPNQFRDAAQADQQEFGSSNYRE